MSSTSNAQNVGAVQNNAENLLDIDFDGAAPASMQQASVGASGTTTPRAGSTTQASNGMDDLMGIFGNDSQSQSHTEQQGFAGNSDLLDGFASLNVESTTQPPPVGQQLASSGFASRADDEDLLG